MKSKTCTDYIRFGCYHTKSAIISSATCCDKNNDLSDKMNIIGKKKSNHAYKNINSYY